MKWLRGFERHRRSLVKAVTWRIPGSVDTFVISFIITPVGSLSPALSPGPRFSQKSPYGDLE
jgi:Predicted membrane protein (DUF2061)